MAALASSEFRIPFSDIDSPRQCEPPLRPPATSDDMLKSASIGQPGFSQRSDAAGIPPSFVSGRDFPLLYLD
jgi:hypothetical protein